MKPAGATERPEALLVLADGTVFEGEAAGRLPSDGVAAGELVFNTVMAGYQEVITDPSYAGQVVAFTYPHIGNYGTAPADDQSSRPWCRGVVVRDLAPRPSSWRAAEALDDYLWRLGVPAIAGVDTRRLTRHIREAGSMPCAFGTAPEDVLRRIAALTPGTDGQDLVAKVTTPTPYFSGQGPLRVVAYDFGIKASLLAQLARRAQVEVVPASTRAEDVLAREPHGVFLSNGPGDPSAVSYAIEAVEGLLGKLPVFGVCLGHQLLALALGGRTFKLDFGHHGGNHPVRRLATGKVEITSQNHSYAVVPGSLPGAEVTHLNLNDRVVEGLSFPSLQAFGVQYHPEAAPGPHDSGYLFEEFFAMISAS